MTDIVVTIEEFYKEFPEFNTETYQTICPRAFRQTKSFFSTKNYGRLKNDDRKTAFYLFCAHLSLLYFKNSTAMQTGAASNGAGLVASANVGEVSVSYVQIPNLDNLEYWLSLTPYGLELLALLEIYTSAPFYFGGSFERVF